MPSHSNDPIRVNFGDDLFGKIVSRLTGNEVRTCLPDYSGRKFFIGGSTLSYVRNGDQIWGAGIRDGYFDPKIQHLRVYAVRGPRTAAILRERGIVVPYCYGDPAILWPEIFPEIGELSPKWDCGIIPHFREFINASDLSYPPNLKVISPAQDALMVLDQIRQCRAIVASSLHGIICAEAIGIPVEPYKLDGPHSEPDFKYADYYAASDREWKPHLSIAAALMGKFEKPPDCSAERKFLKEVFPYNLKIDPTPDEHIPPAATPEPKSTSLPTPTANSSSKLREIEALKKKLQTAKLGIEEQWRMEFAKVNPLNIEIRSCNGTKLEKHILDANAPWLHLPVPVCNIPGMITDEEKQYYAYLTRFYSGRGRVLELGPWLGCSTWHLCSGLRSNPAFHHEKLHVVDDFVWRSSWMDGHYQAADRPANHENFRPLFERFLAEHAEYLIAHRFRIAICDGNETVPSLTWNAGPIELCFIDCGRNIEANEAWYRVLQPHFLPCRTLLVLQDWQTHKEVPECWYNQMKQFTDGKVSQLDQIHELRNGGVSTFLYLGQKTNRQDKKT